MKTEYLDKVTKGHAFCGFCSTGNHDTCKGGIRNGDGSVIMCGCDCADSKPEYCHHCKTTDKENLGRPWLCDDRDACDARLKADLEKNEFYQITNKYFSEESRLKYAASKSKVGGNGACKCCDQPTKGGKFLPGHDSRWLNQLIGEIGSGIVSRADQVKMVVEFSPALAAKLEKRLDGLVG